MTKDVCLYSFVRCLFRYFPQFLMSFFVLVSCRIFKVRVFTDRMLPWIDVLVVPFLFERQGCAGLQK